LGISDGGEVAERDDPDCLTGVDDGKSPDGMSPHEFSGVVDRVSGAYNSNVVGADLAVMRTSPGVVSRSGRVIRGRERGLLVRRGFTGEVQVAFDAIHAKDASRFDGQPVNEFLAGELPAQMHDAIGGVDADPTHTTCSKDLAAHLLSEGRVVRAFPHDRVQLLTCKTAEMVPRTTDTAKRRAARIATDVA